jgi:hypothetical protein
VFDANGGIYDSPRYQPDPDLPRDVELGRVREELDEGRRWMRRYAERHPGEAVRSRSSAVRSEQPVTCPGCVALGVTAEESFLIHHSDADGRPVAASDAEQPEYRSEGGRVPMIYR